MGATKKLRYRRIILKYSGELLGKGKEKFGIDCAAIKKVAEEIKFLVARKVQVGLVIGGGNFFRGGRLSSVTVSRITGDHLGMVATMLNGLAIRDVFEQLHLPVKVMSALPIEGIIERYDRNRALEYFKQNFVVVFVGGIGNPLVTTDTALVLRGIELNADLLLKGTGVNGVYSADPKTNARAKLYRHLTYQEALAKELAVMDLTAFCLGRDHQMKLRIFNAYKSGVLLRIIQGADEGTLVTVR